jgi:hypothetical protein
VLTAGLLFGLSALSVNATHDATGNMHACVDLYTGASRIKPLGQAPNGSPYEILVEWPGGPVVDDMEDRLAILEEQAPDCLSEDGNADTVFEGCNIRVVSGAGATDKPVNGEGNLIVGYDQNQIGATRAGSHNLVGWSAPQLYEFWWLAVTIGSAVSMPA